MAVSRVKELLENHCIPYRSIGHSPTFTAQRTAQSAHIKGRYVAKTVVVKIDGRMGMAVIPAHQHVDLGRLQELIGANSVEIVPETELPNQFPDCEAGAVPPFGNLYGMDVYIDQELAEDEEFIFNGGSHTELLRVHYRDFETLVHPTIGSFAR